MTDLETLERRLAEARREMRSDEPNYGLRRFHVFGPFGNRVEFLGPAEP